MCKAKECECRCHSIITPRKVVAGVALITLGLCVRSKLFSMLDEDDGCLFGDYDESWESDYEEGEKYSPVKGAVPVTGADYDET